MCGPLPIHSDHQDDEIIFRIRNLELNLYLPLASWEATANVYMYIYISYIYIHTHNIYTLGPQNTMNMPQQYWL